MTLANLKLWLLLSLWDSFCQELLWLKFLILLDVDLVLVDVVELRDVRKVMVDRSVDSLIGSDRKDDISHARSFWVQAVIVNGGDGSLHAGPQWEFVIIDGLEALGVGVDGLLLEVAHEPVGEFWCEEIHKEIEVEEYCLGSSDSHSEHHSGTSHGQENEEMHTLILGLLEQVMDPSVVLLESPKTLEVAHHTSDHAWDSSDSLEENNSVEPVALVHFIWIIAGDDIKTLPNCSDHSKGESISPVLWLMMVLLDGLDV